MRKTIDVFQVTRETIRHPVAPWIIRIMYTYQGRSYTRDEMTGAMERLFTRNKRLNHLLPTYRDGINSAYGYLTEQQLLAESEGGYSLTEWGKLIGGVLSPISTDISDEPRN